MSHRPDYRSAPLKSISRQMIAEVCRRLVVFGNLKDYVYVGLGGLEFIDFELFHQTLGVTNMYSIEKHEPRDRLEFNRPYNKIKILHGSTSEVLTDIGELEHQQCIVWLDYTGRLDQSVLSDAAYVATKARRGSAIFVTLNSHLGQDVTLDQIQVDFGEYFDLDSRRADFLGNKLANQQVRALETAISKHTSLRGERIAIQRCLDLRYRDSAQMQLAGWIIVEESENDNSDPCRLAELEFTVPGNNGIPLKLAWPNLTPIEWDSLARQLPVDNLSDLLPPHRYVSAESMEKFATLYRFTRMLRLYGT